MLVRYKCFEVKDLKVNLIRLVPRVVYVMLLKRRLPCENVLEIFRLRLVRLIYCLCEIVLQESKTNLGCGLLRGYPLSMEICGELAETQMASPTNSIKVSEVQHRGEQARGILSDFTHSLYAVFQTKQ
jgi:hypothetical protein